MSSRRQASMFAVMGFALSAFTHGVSAQEAPEQKAANTAIEEVLVTAQKRAERAQDIPASISVVSGAALQEVNATQLADYASYIPGLTLVPGGTPGQNTVVLRGLNLQSGPPMVGTYVDDAPFGSSNGWVGGASTALDLLPYDLDRVEVLRGPQGTLYGANAMGGLIRYVLRKPNLAEFQGAIGGDLQSVSGGTSGGDAYGMINAPLVKGAAGVRASFSYQKTPGYIDFPNQGRSDDNDAKEWVGRVATLWKPTESVSLELSALLQHIDTQNSSTVTLDPNTFAPDAGALANSSRQPAVFTQRLQYYSATLTDELGWATFTSASSYSKSEITESSETFFPFTLFTGAAKLDEDLNVSKFTEELRLASPSGGRLEWLTGLFYTREKGHNPQEILALENGGVVSPDPTINPIGHFENPTTYEEYAAFATGTWQFNSRFDLTTGVRWSHNNQDWQQIGFCSSQSIALFGGCPPSGLQGGSDENVFNYAVSPRLRLSGDTMLYGRVASGYRPGGPNSGFPGIPSSVDADKLVSYEIGLKSSWLDHKLQLDAALYRIKWDQIQLTFVDSNTGVSYFANGSTARAQGFEAAFVYAPIAGLRLGLNTTLTQAYLTSDMPALSPLAGKSGDRLPGVPRWAGSVTADYTRPLNGDWTAAIGAGLRYTGGKRFISLDNDGNCPDQCLGQATVPALPSYYAIDAHVGVSNEHWGVRLFGRNLTNKRAYLNETAGPGAPVLAVMLQPRIVGLNVERKF